MIFDEIWIVYKVLFLFLVYFDLVNFGWFVNLYDWGVLSGNLDYK